MNPFLRIAIFTVARDASFVALAAVGLMFVYSFAPALALDVAATVALIFAVALIIRAVCLTEERFLCSEAWRVTYPDERLTDEQDIRQAHAVLEHLLLRFAKGAAGVASFLYCSALVMSATA
jgi:hypothetical protein